MELAYRYPHSRRDIEKQIVRPSAHSNSTGSGGHGIEYWSANLADTTLRDEVEKTINGDIRRREYLARGMDIAAIREVEQTYAPFASLNPTKKAGQAKRSAGRTSSGKWATSAFVYLLWVSIFGITQMLLNNIIEEKSNRIIEVLLSSVTPGELMMGKLFGIAAVGLTMVSGLDNRHVQRAELEIRRFPGNRRRRAGYCGTASADIEDLAFGSDVRDLLSAWLFYVCGLHPGAGQRVQHHHR